MIKTLIDSGVLIFAARGGGELAEVDEFITNEKPNKSIHRSKNIKIISLYDE